MNELGSDLLISQIEKLLVAERLSPESVVDSFAESTVEQLEMRANGPPELAAWPKNSVVWERRQEMLHQEKIHVSVSHSNLQMVDERMMEEIFAEPSAMNVDLVSHYGIVML